MDNAEFEKGLVECRKSLEKLSMESKSISEKLCSLLEEYDGESGEMYWSCRTMNTDVEDVLRDTVKRLKRLQLGDKPELPTVLIMSIECCERLLDTAELCKAGRQDERRDLRGQISSNLGYLAHHIDSMLEDDILPDNAPDFNDLRMIVARIRSETAGTDELISFICGPITPIHNYLKDLRENSFWENEKE